MMTDIKDQRKEHCLSMADTIVQSIYQSAPKSTVLSWNISSRVATYFQDMPSLAMKVNGFLHKGVVLISYDEGHDYFQIRLLDKDNQVIKTVEDVCFDELGIFIDRMVEREEGLSDAEYQNRIINSLIAS